MRPRRWLIAGLAGAALVLLVGRGIAALYADYRWYAMMGAVRLWRDQTMLSLLVRGLSAAAGTLFVFANLYAVRHSVVSLVLPRRVANLEIGEEVPGRYLMFAVTVLSLVFGALLTLGSDSWLAAGLVAFGAPFREADPYFQADLGFYVYWLPFEQSLYFWVLFVTLLATALVVFLYALTPSLRWERGTLYVSTYVRRHLSTLGALMLVLLAWSYRLERFEALARGSSPAGAFGHIDYHVTLPASLFLSVFALVVAGVVFWAGWAGRVRTAFVLVSAVLVLSFVLHQIVPGLARRFAEPTDPVARERPYVATRASYTRRAYGVDRLAASRGVSLWDAGALVRAAAPGVSPAAAADRVAWIMGTLGLEANVLDRPPERVAPGTWDVEGVLATAVDERGGPVRLDSGAVLGAQPRVDAPLAPVHVADSIGGYELVADPDGALAAVEIESGASRIAHAWSLQDFRLLLGDLPQPSPRILVRRGVRERVAALAPFFAQSSAVSPLVYSDTLFWVIDLYSASETYPLSERYPAAGAQRGYFLHAVTAIVNATSGRVRLVPDSLLDPLATTWVSRFREMYTPATQVPPGLLALLPPALDGAVAQARAYGRYGPRGERPPAWHPLEEPTGDTVLAKAPLTPLALPGTDRTTAVVVPLLDSGERVQGAVLALGGARRATQWLPLRSAGTRWAVVVDRLRAADSASARDGGTVRGAVRAVPVRGELAFVQSAYAWRGAGTPLLQRVLVIAGDSVRAGRSLAAAAAPGATPPTSATPGNPAELVTRVRALYDSMSAAARREDWSAFGQAYQRMGQLLGRSPR